MYFTSGGSTLIDPNAFDALLLYGLACDVRLFFLPLDSHRVGNFADPRKAMSLSCFTQICEDRIQHNLLFKLASLVCQVSEKPLFMAPSPFPSRSCVDDPSGQWDLLAANYSMLIQRGYYDAMRRAFQSLDSVFLPQPDETVIDFLFSKTQFSQGSIRLTEGLSSTHPDNDYLHMNKAYGAIFLSRALAAIFAKTHD
jgi:hypothetical protein